MRKMTVRRWLAAVLLGALLMQAAHPQDAELPEGLSMDDLDPTQPITSLAKWDAVIALITRVSWQFHEGAEGAPEVFRETADALIATWDKNLLAPEARQHLDTLRDRARAESEAGNEAAVKKTIAEASPLLNAQKYRLLALTTYAMTQAHVQIHRGSLRPWLDRASETDRAAAEKELKTAQDALATRLEQVMSMKTYQPTDIESLAHAATASYRLLNQQRLTLMKSQAALPNPMPMKPVTRQKECPAAAAPVAGREKPSLAKDFPSSEDYYPDLAKQAEIDGAPVVRVAVSATGCPERAEIVTTSGVEILDAGALDLALAGKYIPGAKDGQAAPGELVFRVKFEFTE